MFKQVRMDEVKVGQMFKRYSPEECAGPWRAVTALSPTCKSIRVTCEGFNPRSIRRETLVYVSE